MKRFLAIFALSLLPVVSSGQQIDYSADLQSILSRLQSIQGGNGTITRLANLIDHLNRTTDAAAADLATFLEDFWSFWNDVDAFIQADGGAPVSDAHVLEQLEDLLEVLEYVHSDTTALGSELSWHGGMINDIDTIISAVYNAALDRVNTSPDWDGLAGYFSDLAVNINDPGGLGSLIGQAIVDELENLHFQVDVVGDVEIGNFPELSDLDVDFSYFDDWRDYSLDLFGRTIDRRLNYWEWGQSQLGSGSINDIHQNYASINGDWFDAVFQVLFYGAENQEQQHRTLLEILNSVQSTNSAEVTTASDNRLTGLSRDVSNFESSMDIQGNSQISAITDHSNYGVVNDYRRFGNLSSMFQTSALGSFLHVHLGDTVNSQGAAMELSGDLSLSEMSDFVQAARKGTSIMWWLLTFLFSALVLFRVFALFRYVNNTFFRATIGFGR